MDGNGFGVILVALVWIVGATLTLASFVFWIWALVDCLRREFREPLYKVMWVLVILFGHFVGALLYLLIGREQGYRY